MHYCNFIILDSAVKSKFSTRASPKEVEQ